MSGCLKKIEMVINELKPSERKVADYVLKHPEQIPELSISELSAKCGTSGTSIVRFCKNIGYKGYTDFKIKVSSSIALRYKNVQGVIYVNDDSKTVINKISKNNLKAIEITMEILDEYEINKAANAISNSERIDIYGNGASFIVAQDAFYKFVRINKNCTAYSDTHMQLVSAVNLTKDDVAIGVSYSGNTVETVNALKVADNAGATTICITKFGSSAITKVSDIKLFVSSSESFFRSGAMASRIAQLNVVDILFSILLCENYEDNLEYLKNTAEIISNRKY